jgi:hypothetical protein
MALRLQPKWLGYMRTHTPDPWRLSANTLVKEFLVKNILVKGLLLKIFLVSLHRN